ncbi:hypothetical protein BV25DRAFT_1833721 [Artomyces pyxidatus]|uniref:Uncharacterized protein n=1 Tax=Artomyces pyxidatus TaxID=48021 RepID=A0ACB8SDC7_9AGAM|nr:hypothetical protein BV25DRAFT_1833721 [Artomyces pyxidatus]
MGSGAWVRVPIALVHLLSGSRPMRQSPMRQSQGTPRALQTRPLSSSHFQFPSAPARISDPSARTRHARHDSSIVYVYYGIASLTVTDSH